jgi:inner membrane protein
VDPLCHTLAGTALAGAGLRKLSPLATTALVLGANVPDVDVLVYAFTDEYGGLAFRRGITHGLPALIAWPFVVTGVLLAWDRWVRARRVNAPPAARAGPLLLVSMIAVLSHPALDWLNTYGMRWLMPLNGRWSYGDAVFIVDPWLWLGLGAAAFLAWRWRWRGLATWGLVALATSTLVWSVSGVPPAPRIVWTLGIILLVVAALLRRPGSAAGRLRSTRVLLAAAGTYIVLMVVSARVAERQVLAAAEVAGTQGIEAVMAGPVPANPFQREVVVATPEFYRRGTFRWAGHSRLVLQPDSIPRRPAGIPQEVVEAALATRAARDFLVWSRFPFITASPAENGWWVRLGDARYPTGEGISGPAVFVGSDGRARVF